MLYTDDKKAIGMRIKSEMDRLHIPAAQLAKLCDVEIQAVTGWIKTGRILKKNLQKLADHFGRSMRWMVTGEEDGLPTEMIGVRVSPIERLWSMIDERLKPHYFEILKLGVRRPEDQPPMPADFEDDFPVQYDLLLGSSYQDWERRQGELNKKRDAKRQRARAK